MGVDPVWGLSSAKLNFSNGIKMKLSVIMGIVHMTIGVIIKGTNNVFHRDWPSLIFEVIAGLILLLGLFGWMDLLIFSKWFFPLSFTDPNTVVIDGRKEYYGDLYNRLTPSVINVMITTVFSGGSPPDTQPTQYAFMVKNTTNVAYPPSEDMQSSMYGTSVFLLICGVICVPLMLLVKPLCCRPKHQDHVHDEIEFAQIA